jgi:hypothetical protein
MWKDRGCWENIRLQMLTTHDVFAWNAMPSLGHVKCGQKESELFQMNAQGRRGWSKMLSLSQWF